MWHAVHGTVLIGLSLAIGVAAQAGRRRLARVLCAVVAAYAGALWLL
jgi:hypothetical protein